MSRRTPAQAEVAQFAGFAVAYPRLYFDEVARKVLPKGFGTGFAAILFRREAKEVFDRKWYG